MIQWAVSYLISVPILTHFPNATKKFINEFEPSYRRRFSDPFPATKLVELKGPKGGFFEGWCFVIVDCSKPLDLRIYRSIPVTGTFDQSGIITFEIDYLDPPSTASMILLLVDTGADAGIPCPSAGISPLGQGLLTSLNVLDAVGVRCEPSAIHPSLSIYPAFQFMDPQPVLRSVVHIFRDGISNAWYANKHEPPLIGRDELADTNGALILPSQFVLGDPFLATFGDVNPTTSLACAVDDNADPTIYCPNDIIAEIGMAQDDCTAKVNYSVFSKDDCVRESMTRLTGNRSSTFRASHGRIDLQSNFAALVGTDTTHEFIARDESGRLALCSFAISVQHPVTCEITAPGECIDGSEECYFDSDVGREVCHFVCNEVATSYHVSWSYPEKNCYDGTLTTEAVIRAGCFDDIFLTDDDNNGPIPLSINDLMECKSSRSGSEDEDDSHENEVKLMVRLKHGNILVGTCEDIKNL